DGKRVSSTPQLFEPGQTAVTLEWTLPKVSQHTVYAIQAKLDLLRAPAKEKLNKFKFGQEKFLDHLLSFKISDEIFNKESVIKLSGDLGINLNNDENFKDELYKTYFLTLFPSIRKVIQRKK
ncbi:MAG: hypothetical protein IH949_09785, partial [Bacteroidetes bacterium]|nr:hypothetical protein [Bacteroidota bacterium]